jgi:predicted ATPase
VPAAETPLDRIANAIDQRTALLVVDNCEHVRTGAIEAARQLTSRCPNLTLVATSREPLSVPGERVVGVPPLTTAHEPEAASVGESEAMQLLIDRARAARHDFELTIDNAPALLEICRLVDGIPLALELAAARLTSTSARDLCSRMASRLDLLRGDTREERHCTVEGAIDWSYQLLEPSAQALLRRLAVFRGGSPSTPPSACAGRHP